MASRGTKTRKAEGRVGHREEVARYRKERDGCWARNRGKTAKKSEAQEGKEKANRTGKKEKGKKGKRN
jgi:hypothetical protein